MDRLRVPLLVVVAALAAGCGGHAADGDPVAGERVWTKGACEGCHAFRGDTQGNVGPKLDTALRGKDAAFVRESIVNPDAYVEKGYPNGVMPADFAKRLTDDEIDDLVAYLTRS